jgi:hypothetical protein
MSDDNYLTMARLCEKELKKWVDRRDQEHEFRNMTGMEQLIAKASFRSGFMKGFEGKYFGEMND